MTAQVTVFQTVWNLLQSMRQWVKSLIWTSDKTSTVQLGTFTGATKSPGKQQQQQTPKKRKCRRVPAVLYIDEGYWDARDVDMLA